MLRAMLTLILFLSSALMAGETSHHTSQTPESSRRGFRYEVKDSPSKYRGNKKWYQYEWSEYWKMTTDQFVSLPEGTGDHVVVVTDSTCESDLEMWQGEWGPTKIIPHVCSIEDMVKKLKEAGYGPNNRIGTLGISGHGGNNGTACYISGSKGYIGSGMSDEQLNSIRELLADDAVIQLFGCSTARDFEVIQKFANRLGLRVVGNTSAVHAGDSWAEGEWKTATPQKK